MQNDPVVSKASELLRLGLMPSAEELKSGMASVSLLRIIPSHALLQDALTIDISTKMSSSRVQA